MNIIKRWDWIIARETYLQQQIFTALQDSHLIEEIKGTTEQETLNELDTYLCELKESQIRDWFTYLWGKSPAMNNASIV